MEKYQQELSTIHAGHVFNDKKFLHRKKKNTQPEGKQINHVPDKD